MKFSTHETDLLILPESNKETNNLQNYCITNKLSYTWHYLNINGQSWYNKQFLEIPFRSDLLNEIKSYFDND